MKWLWRRRGAEHVAVVRIEDGDIIIIRAARALSPAAAGVLGAQVRNRFAGHEVMVLDAGMTFEVARHCIEGTHERDPISTHQDHCPRSSSCQCLAPVPVDAAG